jgi:hypothetical protein
VVDLLGSLNVTMLPSRTRASHWPHVKANHRAIASRPLNRSQSSAGNSASVGFARAAPVTAGHPYPPPAVRLSASLCMCRRSACGFRSANPCISPVGEKLNAEESAAIRAQPADAQHPRFTQLRAIGRKVSDDLASYELIADAQNASGPEPYLVTGPQCL